jgi:hypothetical protein
VGANRAVSRSVYDTQNPAKWVAGERDKMRQAFSETVVLLVLPLPLVRPLGEGSDPGPDSRSRYPDPEFEMFYGVYLICTLQVYYRTYFYVYLTFNTLYFACKYQFLTVRRLKFWELKSLEPTWALCCTLIFEDIFGILFQVQMIWYNFFWKSYKETRGANEEI